jgi:hypothetical protein
MIHARANGYASGGGSGTSSQQHAPRDASFGRRTRWEMLDTWQLLGLLRFLKFLFEAGLQLPSKLGVTA